MRIGVSRRAVFIEEMEDGFRVMVSHEKLPAREPFLLSTYKGMTIEEILANTGIEKENIYYVMSPGGYFRTRIHFPFTDPQKIEGVIGYEVRDSLPVQDPDCVTDFYLVGNEAQAFSVERARIRSLLESFGGYRENLRAVIPKDVALFHGMQALIEDDGYILLHIESRSIYIQYIEEGRIVNGRLVEFHIYNEEITGERLRQYLFPHLIMCGKLSGNPFVWINRASDENKELYETTESLLEELSLPFSPVRLKNIARYYPGIKTFDYSALPLFGAVQETCSTPRMQINLLKNEFKPRAKGYVSVREFTVVGVLLICLFALGTTSLIFDIGFRKQQVSTLRRQIEGIGRNLFGSTVVDETDARKRVSEVREKIKVLEESTDRHLSGLKLLKELSLYFPGDVVIEYTDMTIERDHIKLSGNVRSFSDIDKIREDLMMSDYFKAVEVTNTGTTGSTGGFTVTFVLDITVAQEQPGGI